MKRVAFFVILIWFSQLRLEPVLKEVARGVYLFKDTCNVYAIVNGKRAVLVDFGSGAILNELPALGIEAVSWIVHTHFHRDQAQGDLVARSRGIRLAVPDSEKKYFEAVESSGTRKRYSSCTICATSSSRFARTSPSTSDLYPAQPSPTATSGSM